MRNAPATPRGNACSSSSHRCPYGPTSSAQTHDPQLGICANGDAQSRVTACSQLLGRTRLDTPTRIAAYVNRGNARRGRPVRPGAEGLPVRAGPDSNNWPALRSRAGSHTGAASWPTLRGSLRAVTAMPTMVAAAAAGAALCGDGPDGSSHRGLQQGAGSEPGRPSGAAGRGLALASSLETTRARFSTSTGFSSAILGCVWPVPLAHSACSGRASTGWRFSTGICLKDDPHSPRSSIVAAPPSFSPATRQDGWTSTP